MGFVFRTFHIDVPQLLADNDFPNTFRLVLVKTYYSLASCLISKSVRINKTILSNVKILELIL